MWQSPNWFSILPPRRRVHRFEFRSSCVRGANHPVRDEVTGRVYMTAQNHGFAVDGDHLDADARVSQLHINDGTVEGLAHKSDPIFSVQYHPEAAPGPNDATYFFRQFAEMIEKAKGK